MSNTWVEYNPDSGMTEHNRAVELTGVVHVTKVQDVEPLLDRNKEVANTGATNEGIKKGLWHYMSIPPAVQYELLVKYGVNVHKKEHWPKLFSLVNEHYPYLKTTHKHHGMKGQGKVYGPPRGSLKLAS